MASVAIEMAPLDAAIGVIPQFRLRLLENNSFGMTVSLSKFSEWVYLPDRREKWDSLAKEPPEQFNKSADTLVEAIKGLKQAIEKLDRDGHLPVIRNDRHEEWWFPRQHRRRVRSALPWADDASRWRRKFKDLAVRVRGPIRCPSQFTLRIQTVTRAAEPGVIAICRPNCTPLSGAWGPMVHPMGSQ